MNTLFAYTKQDIITNIYVSIEGNKYIDIQEAEFDNSLEKLDFKIVLNKNALEDKKYYLRFTHNYQNIKDINVDAFRDDNQLIIELKKTMPKDIILNMDSSSTKNSLYLSLDLYDEEEFKSILDTEKLLFGLAYGIIFCAFLYNFVLFLFNKEKSFLYYSLLQFSLLFFLLNNTMTLDIFKPIYEYIPLADVLGQFALIFAVLFNRSFLDSKKYIPKLDKVLIFFLILLIIDTFLIVFNETAIIDGYLPTSLLLGILVLSSFMVYRQGYKIALFYILGWSIIFICVFLIEYDFLDYPDTYALHFGIPLESLILSFSLAYKMKQLENKQLLHEQMLIHQNKLASMGEMINNIAHQYRQPLTHLSYVLMNINSAHEHGELDKEYLDKKMKQANSQLEFMSETIDNFRDFYKPKKEKELFTFIDAIASAINIIKPILIENKILIEVDIDESKEILGYKNEYSQVILNLISNAKDELINQKIKEPCIKIKMDKNKVLVIDNANGVKPELVNKIFEPYFTTKDKSSGIGLYMSSMIISEHFEGKLYLENSTKGASFIIEI
ncbi:sensor histidine kinase [Poseidonibacter lekithochrous]|uniref:sensor histidine kinase n=1 Tax=Poseidonibacter lekithochrous TaxID=1904463 RepID=UPI0013DA4CB0|nr:sensor histidine kinase [Poseidonibacter lekithochrous]